MQSRNKIIAIVVLVVLAVGAYMALKGSNGDDEQGTEQQAVSVKVMKAIKQDTPLYLEYTGTIKSKQEIKINAKVAGYVVEKYCKGGDIVHAGQPLFRIDSRQYESALADAEANLSEAQTSYKNASRALWRDEQLLADSAIDVQTVDNQRDAVETSQSTIDSREAKVRLAQQNLNDCVIISPIDGQLGLDDVDIGTYVGAGNTPLVTVGSISPVEVQFSLSENEYLKFNSRGQANAAKDFIKNIDVHLVLNDGTEYSRVGHIISVDRSMQNNSGSLVAKAQFDNSEDILVPGMFARVKLQGRVEPGAILVPQRAIQQLLSESFVMVVGENGLSKAVKVELGERVGSYYIIKKGLTGNEDVVVEGLTTLTEGMPLSITNVTAADMGFTFTDPIAKKQ